MMYLLWKVYFSTECVHCILVDHLPFQVCLFQRDNVTRKVWRFIIWAVALGLNSKQRSANYFYIFAICRERATFFLLRPSAYTFCVLISLNLLHSQSILKCVPDSGTLSVRVKPSPSRRWFSARHAITLSHRSLGLNLACVISTMHVVWRIWACTVLFV